MTTTAPSQKVSTEEVRHIAELSNLRLTAEEETLMQRDLNSILEYVAQLSELNTAQVIPMAQVAELLAAPPSASGLVEDSRAILRQDIPVASLPRELVLDSAPETDGIFFKVPKVIER